MNSAPGTHVKVRCASKSQSLNTLWHKYIIYIALCSLIVCSAAFPLASRHSGLTELPLPCTVTLYSNTLQHNCDVWATSAICSHSPVYNARTTLICDNIHFTVIKLFAQLFKISFIDYHETLATSAKSSVPVSHLESGGNTHSFMSYSSQEKGVNTHKRFGE